VGVVAISWLTFGRLLPPFDLLVFLHAGRQVLNGANPYEPVASAAFVTGHAFVYPYFIAWLFVPFALLPTHLATIAYSALSVASIVVGCHLLSGRAIKASVILLMCSTTIIGLQMGTLNALLLLGLAAAWRYRSRPWLSGVLVGMLALAKLFLVPMIVWLVLSRRYRSAAVASGVVVSMLVAGWAMGPIDAKRYMSLLSTLRGNEAAHSWSLTSLLQNLGLSGGAAQLAAFAAGAAVLAASLALRRFGADETAVYCAAVLASLLISPIVWSSYLVLLAVPLLVGGAPDSAMIAFAVASWLLVTPDAASPVRVGVGAAIALVIAATPGLFDSHRRPPGRGSAQLARPGVAEGAAPSRPLLRTWRPRTGLVSPPSTTAARPRRARRRLVTIAACDVALVALSVALPSSARTPFVACVGSLAVGAVAFGLSSRRRLASVG
jgi:alpha-1,2-mannosyltransferase